VQAALLRPILSGWVGDLQLPAAVRSVAAANPADVATDGWDLAPAMANRFTHLSWSLPADVVREGFAAGFPAVAVPVVDPETVERALAGVKITLGAFLGARPELVTRVPTSSADAGAAFPTPRSWEMSARLLATAQVAGCGPGVVTLLLGGTVGLPAATEFLSYLEHLDLPDPEQLLADPDGFVVPTDRGDRVYAIAAAVWAATARENTPARWGACGVVLAKVADAGSADVAYAFGSRWARERPTGALPGPQVVASLSPILTELGLLAAER
jgi:hypothetical protein